MGGQRSRTALGQFQPVHASGHVDVREQHRNVRARFQEGNSFVRITRLESHEACFLDDFDGEHPQERIVLHYENDGRDSAGVPFTGVNEAKRSEFQNT